MICRMFKNWRQKNRLDSSMPPFNAAAAADAQFAAKEANLM